MNEFDEAITSPSLPNDWTTATIAIADTAYLARLWFRSYGVEFTAADLLRFVELVREERKHETIHGNGAKFVTEGLNDRERHPGIANNLLRLRKYTPQIWRFAEGD